MCLGNILELVVHNPALFQTDPAIIHYPTNTLYQDLVDLGRGIL